MKITHTKQRGGYKADFAANPGKMVNKLIALYPIGSAMCEIAHSQVGMYETQTVTIYVREGDTWKIRMLTFNVTPPATAETK